MGVQTSLYLFLLIGFVLHDGTFAAQQAQFTIGDNVYTTTKIRNELPVHHMVVDNDENLLYISEKYKVLFVKADSNQSVEVGGLRHEVVDMVLGHDGVVWMGSRDGVYTYDYATNMAKRLPKTSGHSVYHMTIGGKEDKTVYMTDSYELYGVGQNTLRRINLRNLIYTVAIDNKGDLYFTRNWNSREVLRLKKGFKESPEKVADLPEGGVWLLEVDKTNNYLYICHSTGLYYIAPETSLAVRVDGIVHATGMAFDKYGDMYLGTNHSIVKLVKSNRVENAPELIQDNNSITSEIHMDHNEVLENYGDNNIDSEENDGTIDLQKLYNILRLKIKHLKIRNKKIYSEAHTQMEEAYSDMEKKINNILNTADEFTDTNLRKEIKEKQFTEWITEKYFTNDNIEDNTEEYVTKDYTDSDLIEGSGDY